MNVNVMPVVRCMRAVILSFRSCWQEAGCGGRLLPLHLRITHTPLRELHVIPPSSSNSLRPFTLFSRKRINKDTWPRRGSLHILYTCLSLVSIKFFWLNLCWWLMLINIKRMWKWLPRSLIHHLAVCWQPRCALRGSCTIFMWMSSRHLFLRLW